MLLSIREVVCLGLIDCANVDVFLWLLCDLSSFHGNSFCIWIWDACYHYVPCDFVSINSFDICVLYDIVYNCILQ